MPLGMIPGDDEFEKGSGAQAKKWFPADLADGPAFIGRGEEYRRLARDVFAGRNSWFDCPARYGVASLTGRVRRDLRFNQNPRITATQCDLLTVHDTRSVCRQILTAMGQLAAQVMRRYNVVERKVQLLFPETEKDIYLDERSLQTIRFCQSAEDTESLARIVSQLQVLTADNDCRNILVVTDFQQILALRDHEMLITVIADLIAASPNTTWLFQGSNQHVMRRCFGQPEQPLHRDCRRFALRQIDVEVYRGYFAEAAQARWNCYIGRKAAAMILALTQRHPFWVNNLCRRLYAADLPPVIQNVVDEWLDIVRHQRLSLSRLFERLSPNQRAVLQCLAQTPTDQPRAKSFVRRTRVSSASVGQAIRILAEQDLIELDVDGRWQVKDPVIQWGLHQRTDVINDIYEGRPVRL